MPETDLQPPADPTIAAPISPEKAADPGRALTWELELRIYARESRQLGQVARRLRETADALERIDTDLVIPYLPMGGMLGTPVDGLDPESGWRGRWLARDPSAPDELPRNGLRSGQPRDQADQPAGDEHRDRPPGR
jgi:hypothetical protein